MSTNEDIHLHPDKITDSSLANIICATIFLALSIVCVALRFLHRMRTRSLWWDDWTILLALAAGIGVYVTLVLDSIPSEGASGYRTDQYTLAGLYTWGRISLIMSTIYIVSIAFSRVSVLLFYRRIFSIDRSFLRFVRIMAAIVLATCTAYFFGAIFQDKARVLNTDISTPYTSINSGIFFFVLGLVNILLDVAIVAMVQQRLWKLHMGWRKKLGLSSLLLVVVFSIVAGVLRLMYLALSARMDLTYTYTPALRFEVLECLLYIICASLPLVYNFFRINRNGRSTTITAAASRTGAATAGAGAGTNNANNASNNKKNKNHNSSARTRGTYTYGPSRRTPTMGSTRSSTTATKWTKGSSGRESIATDTTLTSQYHHDDYYHSYTYGHTKDTSDINHHDHRSSYRSSFMAPTTTTTAAAAAAAESESATDGNRVGRETGTTDRSALVSSCPPTAAIGSDESTTSQLTVPGRTLWLDENNSSNNDDADAFHAPFDSHHRSDGNPMEDVDCYDLQPLDRVHLGERYRED